MCTCVYILYTTVLLSQTCLLNRLTSLHKCMYQPRYLLSKLYCMYYGCTLGSILYYCTCMFTRPHFILPIHIQISFLEYIRSISFYWIIIVGPLSQAKCGLLYRVSIWTCIQCTYPIHPHTRTHPMYVHIYSMYIRWSQSHAE